MNKIILTALILIILITGKLSAQTETGEAIQYYNELFGSFSEIKKNTWRYLKAVTAGKNMMIVEKNRNSLLQSLSEQKKETIKDTGFKSDFELRDAVIKYLDMSYIVLKEDFDKILDMEEISEQSYDLMEAYMLAKEKANEKLNTVVDDFQEAENKFVEKYNITLLEAEEDKMSKKIKKAGNALSYYNKLHLIFFKCYKQEAYIIEAQNRNDVSAIQQNTNTLADFTSESIEKLKNIKSYSGDVSLMSSAKQVILFYDKEAKKQFPIIIDFYLKKDNFEKLEKIMNSKKKKDITQEDADRYNKAISDYNKAINNFNNLNKKMNEERQKKLEMWNRSVDKFFEYHTD